MGFIKNFVRKILADEMKQLEFGIPNREYYLSEYQTEETRKYLEAEG